MSKVAAPKDIPANYQTPNIPGKAGHLQKIGQFLRSPEFLLGATSVVMLTAISAASLSYNGKAQQYAQIFNNQMNELQQSLQNIYQSSLNSTSTFYNNFNVTQVGVDLQETLSSSLSTISTLFNSLFSSASANLLNLKNLILLQLEETDTLKPNIISDGAFATLNIRKEHPAEYATSFVSQFFGNSAIGATVSLAAALGEAPINFLEACKDTAGVTWCNLFHLNTLFEQEPARKIKIASAVSEAYDREFLSLDPDNQQRFQYRTPPYKHNELTRTERMATLEDSNRHRTRSDWRIALSDEANTLSISRAARDYLHGERKSRWENYSLSCTKTADTIDCKTDTPLDHKKGILHYQITEKTVSDSCSLVKETLQFPNEVIEKVYALDPTKQLPYFLPNFIHSDKFVGNIKPISTLGDWWTKNIDAKFIASTQFPKDLPTTC